MYFLYVDIIVRLCRCWFFKQINTIECTHNIDGEMLLKKHEEIRSKCKFSHQNDAYWTRKERKKKHYIIYFQLYFCRFELFFEALVFNPTIDVFLHVCTYFDLKTEFFNRTPRIDGNSFHAKGEHLQSRFRLYPAVFYFFFFFLFCRLSFGVSAVRYPCAGDLCFVWHRQKRKSLHVFELLWNGFFFWKEKYFRGAFALKFHFISERVCVLSAFLCLTLLQTWWEGHGFEV